MAGDINPNQITGLASGMDTKSIVNKMVAAEQKKIEPVLARREEKQLELDAWKQVKIQLDQVEKSSTILSKRSMWEGKIVESSNPEVVEAIATSGAKPGKHTLVVDKLALNHQIASQGFAEKDQQIGKGTVSIQIGDGEVNNLVIDDTNNTLQGFVDAIEKLDLGVTSTIIKTGNKEKPFQVVLTSKNTGQEGKISIAMELSGDGLESPTFEPYYTQPSDWIPAEKPKEQKPKPTGTGASTAVPLLAGKYTGTNPLQLTFTVVNTGIVGVSESVKIRWEDDQGRFGYVDMGSFDYTPGDAVPIVDGISLVMSDGEVLVNDTFTASAKNEESDLYWWKSEEEREAAIIQPTSWGKQQTEGGPVITGKYDSEEDDTFKLTVVGNGKVGEAEDLRIMYESENGMKGTLFVGRGYEAGQKLSLGKGLEVSIKPGILTDGAFSTFTYQTESTEDYWWLEDSERTPGGQVTDLTNWILPETDDEEPTSFSGLQEAGIPKKARVSDVQAQVVGKYDSYDSKVYTFTALGDGGVGVTAGLELKWEDNMGNSGILKVGGDYYKAGNAIPFDSGLSLQLGAGHIFNGDKFTLRTFTTVIQPPQDAEVRLGATDLGGGLLITSPTNTLEDVIEGVKLNLLKTDEDTITISVRGDTEQAVKNIMDFVGKYNEMLNYFQEVTKYDKDSKASGPLQGDRNLPRIQSETARIFIDTVAGLEADSNQLITIGLKITKEGLIEVDEDKLTNAVTDDLGRVANLFRSYGECENSGLVYLSSNEKTQISGDKGYDIDIKEAASKGFYTTPVINQVVVTEENQGIFLSINGRESEEIKLEPGTYDVTSLSRELQKKILEDKYIGKMKISVTQDNGQLVIRSNMTGSKSSVTLKKGNIQIEGQHFLEGGTERVGKDVVGTIDGTPMEGSGQILSGPEGSKYDGLKIFVQLTDTQVGDGVEGNMIFTKGVGTKVQEYITGLMDQEKGALGVYTKNSEDQLKGFDQEVKRLEERVESKREKLNEKFARMEAKLGQLKAEQNYMNKELAKI